MKINLEESKGKCIMINNILIDLNDGVLEVAFSRPDKKNALTNDMYKSAREAVERAQLDDMVRVILFTSIGDSFTAGNDLVDFKRVALGEGEEPQAHGFIEALGRAEKPIVAAVPGIAVGIGTTMLLHCDLVYVADSAKLMAPFVNIALVPEAASSLLLPLRIGHVRAFSMFVMGESITGSEAVTLGLANKSLPKDQVLQEARQAAKLLASKPTGSLLATKKLMRNTFNLLERIQIEKEEFNVRLGSEEALEAFSAFEERRLPNYKK